MAPTEILKACEKFSELNLPVELKSFENGVIVIQSCNLFFTFQITEKEFRLLAKYDSVKDFEENVIKLIDDLNGITAEQLSKKLRISPIVSRLKLEVFCKLILI